MVVKSVMGCWDYLAIQGLKASVENYPEVEADKLSQIIEDIGESLFQAYHQKLDNLFRNDYTEVNIV